MDDLIFYNDNVLSHSILFIVETSTDISLNKNIELSPTSCCNDINI